MDKKSKGQQKKKDDVLLEGKTLDQVLFDHAGQGPDNPGGG